MKDSKNKDIEIFKLQQLEGCEEESGSFKPTDYFKDSVRDFSNAKQEGDIRLDYNTIYQGVIAESIIQSIKSNLVKDTSSPVPVSERILLDAGSKFSEALSFSKYFKTIFSECRATADPGTAFPIPGLDMTILNCEAQKLSDIINPGSVSIVTSLHALEHFGLGRYGDEIDYFGDQKGLDSFSKILVDNGYLVLSVPFTVHDSPRIEFNNQRVYSYQTIDSMLDSAGFTITDEWFIFPLGAIRDENDEESYVMPVVRERSYVERINDSKPAREDVGVYLTLSRKISKDDYDRLRNQSQPVKISENSNE